MKKLFIFALTVLMLLCVGCSGKKADDESKQPGNAQENDAGDVNCEPNENDELKKLLDKGELFGVDVSGKTTDEAYTAILKAVEDYALSFDVNKCSFEVTKDMLKLSVDKNKLSNILQTYENGGEISADTLKSIISFETGTVVKMVQDKLNVEPKNAYLKYSDDGSKFLIQPEEDGETIPNKTVEDEISLAVYELKPKLSITVEPVTAKAEVSQNSKTAKSAAEKANNMLSVSLKYTYTPDGEKSSSESISRDTIASFLYVKDDGLSIGISDDALNSYASKMDKTHSVPGKTGKFRTTGGSYLSIEVDYPGQSVDKAGLLDDITYCIKNCISGTRTAPYLTRDAYSEYMFGGNYVEIDLNSQHIWVYNKGKCVVSSPIVSGSVVDKNMTPTGLYSIQNKATDTYLVGPTWRDWVYFWMPFYGGYGMHDADGWRSEYGGDIYLYNGSHGCVNMPYSAAKDTYNNVSIGTKVVLYGGAQSVNMVEQSINGTREYTVSVDSEPFSLDAAAKHSGGQLKYTSSDTSVAVIDENGTVTVKSVGTCTITVESPARDQYTYASMDVAIKVISACEAGRHTLGEWTVTKEPSCTQEGERVRYCTICGQLAAREILPAHGHDFSENLQYCAHGCGAVNPDYVPPEESGGDVRADG